MDRSRIRRPGAPPGRLLLLLLLLGLQVVLLPFAETVAAAPAGPAGRPPLQAGDVRADDDDVSDPFLNRLLEEINARRESVGTPRLAFVPRHANEALGEFLAQTEPALVWPGPCSHHLVDGASAWEYVQAAGFEGEARGEVLACPGPEPYWTPDRTAETWWTSPIHFEVLYADPEANAIACSAAGASSGGKNRKNRAQAAMAVLCVTFHE